VSEDPREKLDPEVLADLQFRDDSERDTTRSRTTSSWSPPVYVHEWECRHPRCDVRVPVTEDTVERLAIFNRQLEARGERPIPCDAVMLCDEHRVEFERHRQQKLRERVDELASVIRQLKASPNPSAEHALIARLGPLGHPEPAALMATLEARGGAKKRRAM
jgi:hypothetical protein